MNRRKFIKAMATLAALPFVAPFVPLRVVHAELLSELTTAVYWDPHEWCSFVHMSGLLQDGKDYVAAEYLPDDYDEKELECASKDCMDAMCRRIKWIEEGSDERVSP